jgi:hypothetical protein
MGKDSVPPDAGLIDRVFPVTRRVFPRQDIFSPPPLRRGIDYQSTARKSMPLHLCKECGGAVYKPDDHERDPDACKLEKVRQVMES